MAYDSGERYGRPAAHKVIERYPHLRTGEGLEKISEAMAKRMEPVGMKGRRQRELPVDEWWHKVRAASEAPENEGNGTLAAADLDPGWVERQLSDGNLDELAAVAGAHRMAREAVARIEEAHQTFVFWLD